MKQKNARAAIKNLKALGLRTIFTGLPPSCGATNKITFEIFFKQLLPATTVRQAWTTRMYQPCDCTSARMIPFAQGCADLGHVCQARWSELSGRELVCVLLLEQYRQGEGCES